MIKLPIKFTLNVPYGNVNGKIVYSELVSQYLAAPPNAAPVDTNM